MICLATSDCIVAITGGIFSTINSAMESFYFGKSFCTGNGLLHGILGKPELQIISELSHKVTHPFRKALYWLYLYAGYVAVTYARNRFQASQTWQQLSSWCCAMRCIYATDHQSTWKRRSKVGEILSIYIDAGRKVWVWCRPILLIGSINLSPYPLSFS